jgi:hypothetical protein
VVRAALDEWLDRTLVPAQAASLERHLGECLGCLSEMRALRDLLEQARTLPRPPPPARDLWPEVAARIGRRRRARIGAGSFAAAASLALLIGALGTARPRPAEEAGAAGAAGPHPLAAMASGGMGGGGVGGAGGVAAGSGGAGQPRSRVLRSTWR